MNSSRLSDWHGVFNIPEQFIISFLRVDIYVRKADMKEEHSSWHSVAVTAGHWLAVTGYGDMIHHQTGTGWLRESPLTTWLACNAPYAGCCYVTPYRCYAYRWFVKKLELMKTLCMLYQAFISLNLFKVGPLFQIMKFRSTFLHSSIHVLNWYWLPSDRQNWDHHRECLSFP